MNKMTHGVLDICPRNICSKQISPFGIQNGSIFLANILRLKFFGSINCWTQNFSLTTMFLDQASFTQFFFWPTFYWNQFFWTKHFFLPKIIWTQHFFLPKIIWTKIFIKSHYLGPNIGWAQNFGLYSRFVVKQKKFGPKICICGPAIGFLARLVSWIHLVSPSMALLAKLVCKWLFPRFM